MIVKDEEELLPRCLDSLTRLADEIIIVDTGSADRTKEIALKYGAKLFDYSWTNNFAAARNESLRHATGKWILVLDADEYLAENEYDKWNKFLNKEKPVSHLAYSLPVVNFTAEKEFQDEITTAPVTRLFSNYKGIYFERPIHEQLTRGQRGKLYHRKIDLNIYHTGYQAQRVTEKNKHERNMSIFNEMKKNDNMSDYDWFTLGNQYRYVRNEIEAVHCYEQAIKGADPNSAWYPHCLVGLISLYLSQDRLELVEEWTNTKLSKFSDYPDYYTIKGSQYEKIGFFEKAIDCYLKAVNIAEQRASDKLEIWLVEPKFSFETPVLQLVELYFKLNDNQQAIYWLSKLLHKNNKNPLVLLKLIEWLCQNESSDSVIDLLNKIYDIHDEADRNLLFKVSLVLGQVELVRYYMKFIGSLDHLSLLDQARLAVITDNQEMWLGLSPSNQQLDADNQLQLWIQMAVGAIQWNNYSVLIQIEGEFQNDEISKLTEFIVAMLTNGHLPEEQDLKNYSSSLFLVAKQLFLIKAFGKFDEFINFMRSSELINQLANYFYKLNLTEMALNYYSILLSEQQLDFTSVVNLGRYHINNQFYEDAVEFFSEAVNREPANQTLYIPLIRHANKELKDYYSNKFITECPQFVNITFVREFLNQEKK
ncbi:tetratricopeptide repeat-containing glycosyltransferase family 2 protein [Paenibacillus sp. FA6]|uniref:tetratricopeptide repeat-containing glycosyltransferase family 2 protein n=1 Tax=Paenibacillus sp. FA6 TaxID=3413029 RepID=UPI003F6591E9